MEWLRIGNYQEPFLKHGWRKFRTFLEGFAEKYGRAFRVISRWESTSYGRCMVRTLHESIPLIVK
ncbi:MAG: hypothetical protein MGG11_09760 [Trichodesmium sp. MAG_R03]|jgi:hypothetical protein|nr:hypothetical protein [Trichodesmium sp. MAG_R03]